MLEGRGGTGGWIIVAFAAFALVAFTGLLYVRGGNGTPISLSGGSPKASASAVAARPTTASAGPSAPGTRTSPRPGGKASPSASPGTPSASASGGVAGATSRPSAAAARTPRPSASPALSPAVTESASGYRLPTSPQRATVALTNGQGGCPGYPTDGVIVETSFTVSSSGRLTATSPSKHRLSGQLKADGSFSLTGASPVERWIGAFTESGGTGSYFIVAKGCTEGYDTTIAFHP